jgi:thymidylate synthase (FAD)
MSKEVKLISVTPDAEKTILYIARVSSDQENESVGLLKYLIRNKHWSPFEMAHMVLEFNTSRAIAQQIIRHRSFAYQEFSQRYAAPTGAIEYLGRKQSEQNRQSSVDNLDEETQLWWDGVQSEVIEGAFYLYNQALQRGIAKECARFILPLSTKTKLYMAGSVRSWIHYFDLRCDEHTQEEHRWLAIEARLIFKQEFPTISEALWPTQTT